MTKEEKIAAISKLMMDGILSADEFTRVISALDPTSGLTGTAGGTVETTPAEKTYADYIRQTIALSFKSPSSVQFPPFDPTMVKLGTIKLDFSERTLRYIETYVDAANSYGTMLREPIIIGIDEEFNPLFWAQHGSLGTLLGKTKGWITMHKEVDFFPDVVIDAPVEGEKELDYKFKCKECGKMYTGWYNQCSKCGAKNSIARI